MDAFIIGRQKELGSSGSSVGIEPDLISHIVWQPRKNLQSPNQPLATHSESYFGYIKVICRIYNGRPSDINN